jgi:hypothetical protein
LKEAFRAKSPIYRAYLNYCFFMQRFTADKQWLVIIGLLVIVNGADKLLGPYGWLVTGAYLLFVLWLHVAMPVGNLQLSFDRSARHALDRGEKIEAWVCGGGVLIGFPLFVVGMLAHIPAAKVAGITLVGAAFPFAYTFKNATAGRWLFGAIGAFVLAAGAVNLTAVVSGDSSHRAAEVLGGLAFLSVLAVTWIANIPAIQRRS